MSDHVSSYKVSDNKRSVQPWEAPALRCTRSALCSGALISEDSSRGPPRTLGAPARCSCSPAQPGGLLCSGTSAAPSRLALQSRALVPLSVGSRSSKKGKADTLGKPGVPWFPVRQGGDARGKQLSPEVWTAPAQRLGSYLSQEHQTAACQAFPPLSARYT